MNANQTHNLLRSPTRFDAERIVKVMRETKTRWNESPVFAGTRGTLVSLEDGYASVKFFGWFSVVEVPAKDLGVEPADSSTVPFIRPSTLPHKEAA